MRNSANGWGAPQRGDEADFRKGSAAAACANARANQADTTVPACDGTNQSSRVRYLLRCVAGRVRAGRVQQKCQR